MLLTLLLSIMLMAAFFLMLFASRFWAMLYLLKAFDMICFDWPLLTKSHFFQHFYPETEGCQSYRKFGFNLKEQIARLTVYPFIALAMAWVCTLF